MDLDFSADERAFLERLQLWLDQVDVPDGLRDFGATPESADVEAGQEWQRSLHSGGWAGLSWAREHGGAGATLAEQAIFAEELARRGLPRQLSFVSIELAGPAIIAFGSEKQRERFTAPILTGEDVWCQLFSEPSAGSDLAALRTRARPEGDGWRVSGQKIWTSGAQFSGFGMLLARTGDGESVHRGISCFLLPMDREGIQVNPIEQMDGESKFSEVFLDDVRVEREDLLGEVGEGWSIARSILGRERRMLGSLAITLLIALEELRDRAEAQHGGATESFRQRWTALASRVELLRWTWFRLLTDSEGDARVDPRTSILKLTSSQLIQQVAELAADEMGPEFAAGEGGEGWRQRFLTAHGATIAGGTSEIQRSILAERVLAMPRDP